MAGKPLSIQSVLYGGAHLYKAGSAEKLARLALASFDRFHVDAAVFARTVGDAEGLQAPVGAEVEGARRGGGVDLEAVPAPSGLLDEAS